MCAKPEALAKFEMINVCAHLEWHIAATSRMDQSQRDVRHDDDDDRSHWTTLKRNYYFSWNSFAWKIAWCIFGWIMTLCAREQTADMSDVGLMRGKPLNPALNASVHKISSIETFPFRMVNLKMKKMHTIHIHVRSGAITLLCGS